MDGTVRGRGCGGRVQRTRFIGHGLTPREPDVLLHVLNFVALGRSNKLPLEIE